MFGGLKSNAPPAIEALGSGCGEVAVRALGDNGNDPRHAQFRGFFDRPFHTVEFVDGEEEGNLRSSKFGDRVAQFEFDAAFVDCGEPRMTDCVGGDHIKFLADAGAKNAREMVGMGARKSSGVAVDFVGDPAAAGHGSNGHGRKPGCTFS